MSGLISVVYSRRKLDDETLDAIDDCLAGIATPLLRTHKGRTWDCAIHERWMHVRIEVTEDVLWDCEDELLDLGLLPEGAPFRIVFAAPSHDDVDMQALALLAGKVSALVDGVIVGPER